MAVLLVLGFDVSPNRKNFTVALSQLLCWWCGRQIGRITRVDQCHNIPTEALQRYSGSDKPFMYKTSEGNLELELSLRITAIREMFEELGVVFCHDQSTASTSPFSHFFHTKDCDIPVWQNKVHNHEESLLAFCERFKVVPDIMNIYAWSCWLTPTFTHTKRYETAFFLAALEHVPPIYPESYEVQEFFVSKSFCKAT